jgi:hypothetical protein
MVDVGYKKWRKKAELAIFAGKEYVKIIMSAVS